MAYVNSGYLSEATVAAQLAMCRLFKAELMDKIGPDLGAEGRTRGNSPLNDLLRQVTEDEKRLEAKLGSASRFTVSSRRVRA